MKNTAQKFAFWVNHILLILSMGWHMGSGQPDIKSFIPLLISSLMLADITYISSCSIRENKVLSLFCSLLALDSWYMVLSFEESLIGTFAFTALSPVIWYVFTRFILMFLFQGSGYQFRKITNAILLLSCIGSLAGIGISDRAYACLYGIQLLATWLCFLFLIVFHWRRAVFVLKSERKSILASCVATTAAFLAWYFATINVPGHISNFGIYLPVLLFFLSVHGIIQKEHGSGPLSTVFDRKQAAIIVCLSLTAAGLAVLLAGGGYRAMFLAVNALFAFIYLCNILLEVNLKNGESKILKESKYNETMRLLQREELLKTEFANFLHDDVLQDLLSIKNMMTKAYRPDIQDFITETLIALAAHIREQMQDYHPVILKNLTARENYGHLIEAVAQSFPERKLTVSFDCPATLFLVEPYHVLVYRLLKELLTNVFKHSDGNQAWVTLTQENGNIALRVSDNGTASPSCLDTTGRMGHKGIASISEQLSSMDGSLTISENPPHGICLQITLPMKGDVSYQYFVN